MPSRPGAIGALTRQGFRGVHARGDRAGATPPSIGSSGQPGLRRTRRWVSGRGPRIDLRRAIADSLHTGGDIVRLAGADASMRPRPLVLLCDVSGSMERYSRMLLHFAHASTGATRASKRSSSRRDLTRITRQLRTARPDRRDRGRLTIDAGLVGRDAHRPRATRVAPALGTPRAARRAGGPLISDGWDRGDPQELSAEIARLQREPIG